MGFPALCFPFTPPPPLGTAPNKGDSDKGDSEGPLSVVATPRGTPLTEGVSISWPGARLRTQELRGPVKGDSGILREAPGPGPANPAPTPPRHPPRGLGACVPEPEGAGGHGDGGTSAPERPQPSAAFSVGRHFTSGQAACRHPQPDSGPLILFGSVPPCVSDPHQLLCPETSFHSLSLQLCP